MSEGTKAWDPRVETTRLRERVQILEGRDETVRQQLLVAAQNFGIVKRALEGLIARQKTADASLALMTETVRQQQVQIEGLALIQRLAGKPAPLRIGHTPAEISPFKLP